MNKEIIVLSSYSQLDIVNTAKTNVWERNSNLSKVNVGDVLYIRPNKEESKAYGDNALVCSATIKEIHSNVSSTQVWPSGFTTQNGMRLELENVKLIKMSDIAILVDDINMGASGVKYVEITL